MRRPPFLFGFACLSLMLAACSGVDPFGDRPYVGSTHATAPRASPTLPVPAPEPMPAPAPGSTSASSEDQRMFLLVNEIRASKGLHPFRWNERLYRAAIDHSTEQEHNDDAAGHRAERSRDRPDKNCAECHAQCIANRRRSDPPDPRRRDRSVGLHLRGRAQLIPSHGSSFPQR